MVKGLETFKFKPAAFQRMHLNCLPASLSVHHLVNIMIPSIALRSSRPLVISPGSLIHSFMSSTRSVPGRSLIGLSDPRRPPLPERLRSVHTVHPKAPSTRPGQEAGADHLPGCLFARRGLCAYTYRRICGAVKSRWSVSPESQSK